MLRPRVPVPQFHSFKLKKVNPVLPYRCNGCRKNNIPIALKETPSDLYVKFNKFKINYEELLKIVTGMKSEIPCVPSIKKKVEFINSDNLSEKLIAESIPRSTLRTKKAKNFVVMKYLKKLIILI